MREHKEEREPEMFWGLRFWGLERKDRLSGWQTRSKWRDTEFDMAGAERLDGRRGCPRDTEPP